MSERGPRHELIRKIREGLVELSAEGVAYLGPLATRARARPAAAADEASQRGDEAKLRADETSAAAAPGFEPRVAPLVESAELSSAGLQKAELLEAVRIDLGECTRCKLCEKRKNIVFGEGNPGAQVVFVGEGPGDEEDRSGRPFVGRSGELLTKMIQSVGWQREDVYICNIVKCRPPGNRNPEMEEVAACRPFLERQLLAIRPLAIVTLGKPAASTLLGRNVAITRERGHWQEWNDFPLMPTFHPAYLLRSYTQQNRQAVWNDLKAVRARVDEALVAK